MPQRSLTKEQQEKKGYPEFFEKRMKTFAGFQYHFRKRDTLDDTSPPKTRSLLRKTLACRRFRILARHQPRHALLRHRQLRSLQLLGGKDTGMNQRPTSTRHPRLARTHPPLRHQTAQPRTRFLRAIQQTQCRRHRSPLQSPLQSHQRSGPPRPHNHRRQTPRTRNHSPSNQLRRRHRRHERHGPPHGNQELGPTWA